MTRWKGWNSILLRSQYTETLNMAFLPLITSLLLAGAFIAGKFATTDLSPLVTAWLRFAIALGFLSGLAIVSQSSPFRVARSDLFLMVLLGVFGIVGYHYFFFASLQYTTVGNTALIKATNPVITGFIAAIALREKLTPKNYWGGICGSVPNGSKQTTKCEMVGSRHDLSRCYRISRGQNRQGAQHQEPSQCWWSARLHEA